MQGQRCAVVMKEKNMAVIANVAIRALRRCRALFQYCLSENRVGPQIVLLRENRNVCKQTSIFQVQCISGWIVDSCTQ